MNIRLHFSLTAGFFLFGHPSGFSAVVTLHYHLFAVGVLWLAAILITATAGKAQLPDG